MKSAALRRSLCTAVRPSVVARAVSVPAADVHPPFARYAHATVVPAESELIFTSGQLGILPDGSIPSTAEEQATVALGNVASILKSAGAGVEHIVRLNSYVTGREHLAGYMRARDAIFGETPPTASTLMIVGGFARPEFVVEVIATERPATLSLIAAECQ